MREAVTWRPDVVQDLYVEVSQALEHPRIISSTLEKIVETSQDATIYVHYCTGDVMHRISPDAQGIVAVGNCRVHARRVPMTSNLARTAGARRSPPSGRCATRATPAP